MDLQSDVSPVRPEEHARVLEVWEASVRATHDFLDPADIAFLKPLVRDAIGTGVVLNCVRDGGGSVFGFSGVNGGKIEMLFVDPAHFRRGIGSRLLRHAVEVLGATAVDVHEQHPYALRFFERMGFEVVGRSEIDGAGQPYPLLHLRRASR